MKSVLVTIFLLCVANTLSADVFDDLDRELAIIKKYCDAGQGRISEEIHTSRDRQTGTILSETFETVVYCRSGSRHIVVKNEDVNIPESQSDSITLMTKKQYKCTFEKSFLIGMCEGKQYFYVEEQSSIKRKDLTNFYRFVEKQDEDEIISDICSDISSKKSTDTLIKCNDFGIVLMRDDR